jgi:methionine synthase II (cobalamin-independent)
VTPSWLEPGLATGVGSLPGDDPHEAVRMVLGVLPDLPFLPELPARGPHGDLAGRGAALLTDLSVDLQPTGWRVTARPSRDGRRARDLLARDLDALEELAATAGAPPRLKVQACGPWTLAALVELSRGDRLLADPGAVADLAASLAQGLREHLADLQRRLPGTQLVLQLDEPVLPGVLAAQIPTASGFGRLRAPDRPVAVERLRTVLAVTEATVVHCCAARPPLDLLRASGAGALSLDLSLLTARDDDELGGAVEDGMGLLLGVLPGTDADLADLAGALAPVKELWRRLGFAPERLPATVVVTPACGLAGATPAYARKALEACRELARRLGEEPE